MSIGDNYSTKILNQKCTLHALKIGTYLYEMRNLFQGHLQIVRIALYAVTLDNNNIH